MTPNIERRKVPCGQRVLEYQLTRKQVKNINLRIKPDGQICVSASNRVPVGFIDDWIEQKQEYIIRALDFCEKKRQSVPDTPKQYIDGESFNMLGRSLQLKVIQGQEELVSADGDFLFLTVKDKENQKHKEKLINQWIKEIQIETFNQICREVHQIFQRYNIEYPIVKVRRMTSRWGSCQPGKGIITLNSKLIETPKSCIEYVVLHEFAHFIHPNHSRQFYNFVELLMPDWKERKKELEKQRI